MNLPDKILIYTRVCAYKHTSISSASVFISKLCNDLGFKSIISDDPKYIEDISFCNFRAIIFVNNSGDIFDLKKEKLTHHIKQGRGVFGIHAALATFLDGEDDLGSTRLYAKTSLIEKIFGTHFLNHPPPQKAEIFFDKDKFNDIGVVKGNHNLPSILFHNDEFFNYVANPSNNSKINVLAYVNEDSYSGGLMGNKHPIVWYQNIGKNKAPIFYCALGHYDNFYNENNQLALFIILTGLKFVLKE